MSVLQIYPVKFPTALPAIVSDELFDKEMSWFGERFLAKLRQQIGTNITPEARIIRRFRLVSGDKLSPDLYGTDKIKYLPIDEKVLSDDNMSEDYISRIDWYEEDAFILSTAPPPAEVAISKEYITGGNIRPLVRTDYYRQLFPWLLSGDKLQPLEVSSLYIHFPFYHPGLEVVPPGRYAAFIELYAPPLLVDGSSWLTPLARYMSYAKPKEIWTVTYLRPLTQTEVNELKRAWRRTEQFLKPSDEEERERITRLKNIMRQIGADNTEILVTVKSGIMLFADTEEQCDTERRILQDEYETVGWQTNNAPLEQGEFLKLFFPHLTPQWTYGDFIMTGRIFVATGFVQGFSVDLGKTFIGTALSLDKNALGSFFFDPFEAGLKGYKQVSNYLVTITGAQGSGKSFFGKTLIMNLRRKYGDELKIRIIDLTGEYSLRTMTQGAAPFIEAIGGKVVRLVPNGPININPLEISVAEWIRSLEIEEYSRAYTPTEIAIVDRKIEERRKFIRDILGIDLNYEISYELVQEWKKEAEENSSSAYTRDDLVLLELSQFTSWLNISFSFSSTGLKAADYLGRIKKILRELFLWGPVIGSTLKEGRPVFMHYLRDVLYRQLLTHYVPAYITRQENLVYSVLNDLKDIYKLFAIELWIDLKYYFEKNPERWGRNAFTSHIIEHLLKHHHPSFFSIPRYSMPMIQDVHMILSELVNKYGQIQLESLLTALSVFTESAVATIMKKPHTTLPPSEEPALSVIVDRTAFSEEEQVLLNTLLLDQFLKESINYQIRTSNAAKFFIVIDEMWKLLNNSEHVRHHIANVIARDTRKYLIGGLYMSQMRSDFYYPGSPFSTSVAMKFFGKGEQLKEGIIEQDAIPPMLHDVYRNLGSHQFLMVIGTEATVNQTALVKVVPSRHEVAYAEVISQQAE